MASSRTYRPKVKKLENPGYSFQAARFNWWKLRYEGGGVIWVGEKGGDTPENREKFIAWYLQNSPDGNLNSIVFIE